MANLKSSKKDIGRIEKKTLRNRSIKSKVRTFLKKANEALLNKTENVKTSIVAFESVVMKAAQKGVVSKKAASRLVSKLVHKMYAMEKA